MSSKLAVLVISLLLAAGTSLTACSSNEPIPDESQSETPEYEPVEGSEYEGYGSSEQGSESQGQAQQQPRQPQGQPQQPQGQQPQGQPQPQPQQPQQGSVELPEATGPVATVDGRQISADEFNEQVDMLEQQAGGQLGHLPPQYVEQMQEEIIAQLIQQRLIEDAIEASDIEVTEEDVDERLEELREEFEQSAQAQFDEDMDFDDFVAEMGMSPDELDEIVEETVAIEKILEARGDDMPTDEDVRNFYDENPEMFTLPERVETRQIIVDVATGADTERWEQAQQQAQEIRNQLAEDELTFEEAQEQYDDVRIQDMDVERQQQPAGMQGMQQPPQQPQELEDAAFDELEDGEVSQPIRTDAGWLVVQRVTLHEEGVADFEEVEEQLERDLRNQAMQQALQGFLTELEQGAEIERHPENIQ